MSGRAFWLDASACSGCKACQVACKDKYDLPVGVRWRRVYEVVGGGWTREGGAWSHDVFAYNLSVACNHCDRPICVDVCPTGAMLRRDDGVVLVDSERCVGCRYCEWACPYGAPQYDAAAGYMTKCTSCADELDRGGRPACVDACVLRVLDFGTREELEARHGADASVPYPLPDPGLTEPGFLVRPHGQAEGAAARGARVANLEEVAGVAPEQGSVRTRGKDRSLVAFTLLVQTAVGMVWALGGAAWVGGDVGRSVLRGATPMLLVVGVLLALAGGVALPHLGTPRNAWRALARTRTSWLSREVLMMGIFGVFWAVWLLARGLGLGPDALWALPASAAGAGLLYAMARVYRLPVASAWDTPLTPTDFFLSAGSLGGLAAALGMGLGSGFAPRDLLGVAALCLMLELSLGPAWRAHRRTASGRVDPGLNPDAHGRARGVTMGVLRPVFLVAAVLFALEAWWVGGVVPVLVALGTAGLAAVQGRSAFYDSRTRVGL